MEFSDLFAFEKFVTRSIVKAAYWLGLCLILIVTLACIFSPGILPGFYERSSITPTSLIVGVIVGAFLALVWRIRCEVWLATVEINERLASSASSAATVAGTAPHVQNSSVTA